MRNRQAQYIPASGKQLGIIQPIDTKYAFMAQPQNGKNLIVNPMDRLNYLAGQSAELNNEITNLELGYQQLQEDMVNTVTSYGGGTDAFFTSNDPAVVNKRNEFYQRASMLNKKRDAIESVKNTLKQNSIQHAEDTKVVEENQVAITNAGIPVAMEQDVEIVDESGNKKTVKQLGDVNMSWNQILGATSHTNKDKKEIKASDLQTAPEYLEKTNNYLPAFIKTKEGAVVGVKSYENIIPINSKESETAFTNLFEGTGKIGVDVKTKKKDYGAGVNYGVTITNANSSNMLNLLNVIQGVTDPMGGLMNESLNNYLANEYVKYVKDGGVVPLLKLKAMNKDGKELTDAEFKAIIKEGLDVSNYEFNIDYITDENDKEEIYDKQGYISKEGFMSFVLNKAVKHANPNIDLTKKSGEEFSVAATQGFKPETQQQVSESDAFILGLANNYAKDKVYAAFSNVGIVSGFKKAINSDAFNYLTPNTRKLLIDNVDQMALEQEEFRRINEEYKSLPITQKTRAVIDDYKLQLRNQKTKVLNLAILSFDATIDDIYANTSINPTAKKIAEEYAHKLWNMHVFGVNRASIGPETEVNASAMWVEYTADESKDAGNIEYDLYMFNGTKLSKGKVVQYDKYSSNAPRYDKQYTFGSPSGIKTIYISDAQNWDDRQTFYRYSAEAPNEMIGDAIMMSVVVNRADLINEYKNTKIPLASPRGGIYNYGIEEILKNPYLASQIGIDIAPNANKYNSEGWTAVNGKDFKGDTYIVKVLKYNVHNFAPTSGGNKPISGIINK